MAELRIHFEWGYGYGAIHILYHNVYLNVILLISKRQAVRASKKAPH
jgi:hypothetical protein